VAYIDTLNGNYPICCAPKKNAGKEEHEEEHVEEYEHPCLPSRAKFHTSPCSALLRIILVENDNSLFLLVIHYSY